MEYVQKVPVQKVIVSMYTEETLLTIYHASKSILWFTVLLSAKQRVSHNKNYCFCQQKFFDQK